ncbi:MAG: phosphatase PAP2 family protein [Sandaracinaceae bacterium]
MEAPASVADRAGRSAGCALALALLGSATAWAQPAPTPPTETQPQAVAPEGEGADTAGNDDDAPIDDARPEADPEDTDEAPSEESEDVVERLGDAMGRLGDIGEAFIPEPEPDRRVRWDPTWPRYRFDELVITAGAGLVILLEELLPTRTDANWRGVSDLDLEVARGLGLNDAVARDAIEEVSDGVAAALFVWPVLVDSLVYAGLGEGAWDVAWQLSLISLEVFALNHALTVMVRLLTRREPPLGRFCRSEPGYDADPVCRDQPPAESFWSAHVSNTFAGAALICMYHDVLDLYGDDGADYFVCGTSLAAAVATGFMRIMSDYQWVTDVLSGAVIGSLTGILIPWILHFQGGARPPLRGQDVPTIAVYPMMGDGMAGLGARGTF